MDQDWLQALAAPIDKRAELAQQIKDLLIDELTAEAMCYLVDLVDDAGFLTMSIEQVCALFSQQTGYTSSALMVVFQRALDQLKQLDQKGIGCTDLADYLCWQLDQQSIAKDSLLYVLCQQYLSEVAQEQWGALCQTLQCSKSQLLQAVQQLKQLSHRAVDLTAPQLNNVEEIHPDLYLSQTATGYEVALYQPLIEPYLRQDYEQVLKQASQSPETEALKKYWQQAKDYLSALQLRQHTVLTVAQYLVDYQSSFLSQGVQQLRPLGLEQVAQATGLSMSTVSRLCRQKYLSTPKGNIALTVLLAQPLTEKNTTTAQNLEARIQYYVDNENKKQPLSDTYLVRLLAKEGIQCARRTISKYRQKMNIPNTKYRQQGITNHHR